MQDEVSLGPTLPSAGGTDAPAPGAFQDLLQQMGAATGTAPGPSPVLVPVPVPVPVPGSKLAQPQLSFATQTGELPQADPGTNTATASSQPVLSSKPLKAMPPHLTDPWPNQLPSVATPSSALSPLPAPGTLQSNPLSAPAPPRNAGSPSEATVQRVAVATLSGSAPLTDSGVSASPQGGQPPAAPALSPVPKRLTDTPILKSLPGTKSAAKPDITLSAAALPPSTPALPAASLPPTPSLPQVAFKSDPRLLAVVPADYPSVPSGTSVQAQAQAPPPQQPASAINPSSAVSSGQVLSVPENGSVTNPAATAQASGDPTIVPAPTSFENDPPAEVPGETSTSNVSAVETGASSVPSKAGAPRPGENANQPAPKSTPLSTRAPDARNIASSEQLPRIQSAPPSKPQQPSQGTTAGTSSVSFGAAPHTQTNNPPTSPSTSAASGTPISTPPTFMPSTSVSPGSPTASQVTSSPKGQSQTLNTSDPAPPATNGTNPSLPLPPAATGSPTVVHGNQPGSPPTANQASIALPGVTPAPTPADRDSSPQTQTAATKATATSPAELTDVASPALTHARLTQSLNGSQMQVNLSTEEFGRVSVHAGYSRNAVTAQITLDNAQLGSAITAHLPGAEGRLAGDHGLRAAITVAGAAANGSPADSRSGSNARDGSPYSNGKAGLRSNSSLHNADAGQLAVASSPSISSPIQASSGRLNIRI